MPGISDAVSDGLCGLMLNMPGRALCKLFPGCESGEYDPAFDSNVEGDCLGEYAGEYGERGGEYMPDELGWPLAWSTFRIGEVVAAAVPFSLRNTVRSAVARVAKAPVVAVLDIII